MLSSCKRFPSEGALRLPHVLAMKFETVQILWGRPVVNQIPCLTLMKADLQLRDHFWAKPGFKVLCSDLDPKRLEPDCCNWKVPLDPTASSMPTTSSACAQNTMLPGPRLHVLSNLNPYMLTSPTSNRSHTDNKSSPKPSVFHHATESYVL